MNEGLPFAENVVGKPEKQTGLSHRGVADEEELEEIVVILVHLKNI